MRELPLKTLNPGFTNDGDLLFDCPSCEPEVAHIIGVPTKKPYRENGPLWAAEHFGDPERVTLSPSIDFTRADRCKFHGWVRNGKVQW